MSTTLFSIFAYSGGIYVSTLALFFSIILNESIYFFADNFILTTDAGEKLSNAQYHWIYRLEKLYTIHQKKGY